MHEKQISRESFFLLMNAVYHGRALKTRVHEVFDILDLDADD